MTISYDGNIVVAGSIIKLKDENVKRILKDNLHDCVFDTYKITEDYIKLIFTSFELSRAIQQLSLSSLDYEVQDRTVYIKLKPDAKLEDTVTPEPVKEEAVKAPEPVKEEVVSEPVKVEPVKEETEAAPETEEVKTEEAPEVVSPTELTVKAGDTLTDLTPGEYDIKFDGINFAILSQGKERDYVKEEKVITITEDFKKLTGVSTKKKK